MSIESILYRKIGNRLKNKREANGLTQSEIGSYELTFIDRNIISKIERGELFKTRKTFITENEMDIFVSIYKTHKVQILFGKTSEEIEELIYELYMYIAYSFNNIPDNEYWNKYCNNDSNINKVAQKLERTLYFSALFSFYHTHFSCIYSKPYYNGEFNKDDIDWLKSNYDRLIDYYWTVNKEEIIENFVNFINDQKISMKSLQTILVTKWVNKELYKYFDEKINDKNEAGIRKVGYRISEQLVDNAEDIVDFCKFEIDSKNDLLHMVSIGKDGSEQKSRKIRRIQENTIDLLQHALNQEVNLNIYIKKGG